MTFKNVSEKVAHDGLTPTVANALGAYGVLEQVTVVHPRGKTETHYRLKKDFRPFLRLKLPKRISNVTTTCTVASKDGEVLATGKAYCSVIEGEFNRAKARRKALGRALKEFTSVDKHDFMHAYEAELKSRQLRAASHQAMAAPPL